MDIYDITIIQLKRAAAIKERIEVLNNELRRLLGTSNNSRSASTKSRAVSASVRRKIAAAQKARWAKVRRAKPAVQSAKPAGAAPKKGGERLSECEAVRQAEGLLGGKEKNR